MLPSKRKNERQSGGTWICRMLALKPMAGGGGSLVPAGGGGNSNRTFEKRIKVWKKTQELFSTNQPPLFPRHAASSCCQHLHVNRPCQYLQALSELIFSPKLSIERFGEDFTTPKQV